MRGQGLIGHFLIDLNHRVIVLLSLAAAWIILVRCQRVYSHRIVIVDLVFVDGWLQGRAHLLVAVVAFSELVVRHRIYALLFNFDFSLEAWPVSFWVNFGSLVIWFWLVVFIFCVEHLLNSHPYIAARPRLQTDELSAASATRRHALTVLLILSMNLNRDHIRIVDRTDFTRLNVDHKVTLIVIVSLDLYLRPREWLRVQVLDPWQLLHASLRLLFFGWLPRNVMLIMNRWRLFSNGLEGYESVLFTWNGLGRWVGAVDETDWWILEVAVRFSFG